MYCTTKHIINSVQAPVIDIQFFWVLKCFTLNAEPTEPFSLFVACP